MNCRDFRRAHLDYTDRTLNAKRFGEAQAHLEGCGDCARIDTLVRRSLMLAHSLPPVAPSPRFDPRRTAWVARQRGIPRRYPVTVTGLLAAASTAFIVGLASGVFLFRHPAGTVASLPPVVALALPPAPAAPGLPGLRRGSLMRADFMTGASGGMRLWSAASLIDEAPARFVSAQLVSVVPAR
jgi:hypothetical protein